MTLPLPPRTTENSGRELVKPGTRNEEMGNGKWEMTEMGNGGRPVHNIRASERSIICLRRVATGSAPRARCDDEEPGL